MIQDAYDFGLEREMRLFASFAWMRVCVSVFARAKSCSSHKAYESGYGRLSILKKKKKNEEGGEVERIFLF